MSITETHMFGYLTGELAVDFCRIGLFPAVGVDEGGQFVLGPFHTSDGDYVLGSASVGFSSSYFWAMHMQYNGETISGYWPLETKPSDVILKKEKL